MADLESAISLSDSGSARDALEIVFDDEATAIHRRRSSMVATYEPKKAEDEIITPVADCFVHQLLENHRRTSGLQKHALHPGLGASNIPEDENTVHQHIQSRLLSKKQLSDMAFSIRELSKKLAHIKLKLKVHNIFILGKAYDDVVNKHTHELVCWLLSRDPDHRVYVENTLESNLEFNSKEILEQNTSFNKRLKYWDNELCARAPQIFDIVIALGGDGTVLYASHLFQRIVPPVIAFALGSLGFLTKFDFEGRKEALEVIFAEGFNVNLRLRFEATIMRNKHDGDTKGKDIVEELIGDDSDRITHHPDGSFHILNEVVLDRGPNGTMITLEVFGDNEYFTTVQADGICVATPTGSTAYNLAAGGSLCHPDNPVVLLTAICAHTLSFRPIILPDTIVLRIGVPYDARVNSWASFDGRERVELFPGDYVTISASRFPFPSVLPLDRMTENWIDSISRTLNWNSRQRQKAWHPVLT